MIAAVFTSVTIRAVTAIALNAKDTSEKIDIVKLNAEIAQIVARENELRAAIDQIVAEIEG